MKSIEIVSNKALVGREAVNLVHSLTSTKSEIYINKSNRKINAKSILGILSGGIEKGETLIFDIINDEEATEIQKILNKYFSEE